MTPPNMLRIDDITWPVTYHFVASSGSGFFSWELSFDIPSLNTLEEETKAYGGEVWKASIATAICSSVRLEYWETLMHKVSPAAGIGVDAGARGRIIATPAPRDHTAIIGFNTDHADSFGRRRFYLYGMPHSWYGPNGLSEAGWTGAMGFAHLLAIGCSHHFGAGLQQLLLPYWNVIPADLGNIYGVAFRRVSSYNVFQFDERAPDANLTLWPPAGS